MSSMDDVPRDVLASHVMSRLPFEKLCACVSSGGSLRAAALMLLQKVPRVRALQELKFRERASQGVDRMSKEHFVSMFKTMHELQHVVCDSTVVADAALGCLVHAMREVEALFGRQVRRFYPDVLSLQHVMWYTVFVAVPQVHSTE
jgi:hypothetical protein